MRIHRAFCHIASHVVSLKYRDECQKQTVGFAGNKHQKFSTVHEAKAFLSQHGVNIDNDISGPSALSTTSSATLANRNRRQHGAKPYSRPAATAKLKGQANGSDSSRWAALATEVVEDESGWDVVYSDGACKGNGRPGLVAGIGVWWGPDDTRYDFQIVHISPFVYRPTARHRNIAERCPGLQTNNRAELTVRC